MLCYPNFCSDLFPFVTFGFCQCSILLHTSILSRVSWPSHSPLLEEVLLTPFFSLTITTYPLFKNGVFQQQDHHGDNIGKATSLWMVEPEDEPSTPAPASATLPLALIPLHFPALNDFSLCIIIFQSYSVNVPLLLHKRVFPHSACQNKLQTEVTRRIGHRWSAWADHCPQWTSCPGPQ